MNKEIVTGLEKDKNRIRELIKEYESRVDELKNLLFDIEKSQDSLEKFERSWRH